MTEAINIGRALFVATDGETYPITNWFDADGDECAPEDAIAAVAGVEGRWFALDLRDFVESLRQ